MRSVLRLSLLCAALTSLGPTTVLAQRPYSGSASTEDFSSYGGLGLRPGGGEGALDSSAWIVESALGACGLDETCPSTPPPSTPTAPFYGGVSPGGVSTAGLFGFDTGAPDAPNPTLGVQVIRSFTLTAVYRNDSGAPLSALSVGYTFGERNDQGGRIRCLVSLDPDGPGSAAPIPLGDLTDTSSDAAVLPASWALRHHATELDLSAVPVAVGDRFDVVFEVAYFSGISGGRDEISIDDLSLGPVAGAICGDGVVQPGEQCEGGAAACCSPTCMFAETGSICGAPSLGVCDPQDACDAFGRCIASFASATTVCRAPRGACDVAEYCTGLSAVCPVDRLLTAVFCRTSGPCNPPERCTGTSPDCPTDVFSPDGSSCSNGAVCDGDELCRSGRCTSGTSLSCDDGEVCTADFCGEPSGCGAAPIAGCCHDVGECDDGDLCTVDTCSGFGGRCGNARITGCCTSDADCADANVCTANACDLGTNTCVTTPVPDCCGSDADCDDGNACTADACDGASGACGNAAIDGCCLSDGDCDDGDACTVDRCSASVCQSASIPGCGIDGGIIASDAGILDGDASIDDAGGIEIDAAVETDAGVGDAGGTQDAAVDDAAFADAAVDIDAGGAADTAGCGCRAAGPSNAAGGLVLVGLLSLVLGLRRRR